MRELTRCELEAVSGGWDNFHNPLDPTRSWAGLSEETEAMLITPPGSWVEDANGNFVPPDEVSSDANVYFGSDTDQDGIVDQLEGGKVHIMVGSEVVTVDIPSGPDPI